MALEEQKKINKLLEERVDNLIYIYKIEGRSPKDFRYFKNLRDANLNIKSSLGEIRKRNPDFK